MIQVSREEIIIRPFKREDINDLITGGFPFNKLALKYPWKYKALQLINLIPKNKRIVAYHSSEKKTIGFLTLVKCSPHIYSIQYVFVNPRYRRMGVATKLLTNTISIVKIKGGRKVFADVPESNEASRELFKKLGFETLSIAVEAYGSIKSYSKEAKNFSSTRSVSLRSNKKILFDIYRGCVSSNWIYFFEITIKNFHKGYIYHFHRLVQFICRKYFINDNKDSFAIVYKCPFSNKALIELYSIADPKTAKHMLQDIFTLMSRKGVETIIIIFFGKHKYEICSTLKEMGFNTFLIQIVGRDC
jgi:ribosomal protein S18 acetylase RimI-like enzyme